MCSCLAATVDVFTEFLHLFEILCHSLVPGRGRTASVLKEGGKERPRITSIFFLCVLTQFVVLSCRLFPVLMSQL